MIEASKEIQRLYKYALKEKRSLKLFEGVRPNTYRVMAFAAEIALDGDQSPSIINLTPVPPNMPIK